MDAIQPVGAMIQPPDPNKPLNAYSTLLGIQQQQLGIQQQEQGLQGQAAQVSQEQQKNNELKSLQQFAARASQDPAYHNSDGSLNVQKFQQDAMAHAPTYGAQYIGQMTSNANGAVENRKALLALSNEQLQTIGNYFGAVAAKPGATDEDFDSAVEQARGVSDDPAYQKAIDRMLRQFPSTRELSTDQASGSIRQTARMIAMATGAQSAAASNPQMETYQAPNNILGLRQTNPQSPLGMGSVGGTVAGVAPSQQPDYLARATTATTAAGGQTGTDNQVFSRVMSAGADSARGVELAQKVEQEAGMVRTGKFSKEFADRLTVLQQHDPSVTARQLLQKDAENLKTLAEGTATTDSERQQIGAGFPSPESMDPDAVQKAARYWQGSFRMAGARRDNAVAHVSQNGTAGLALKDSQFMSTASPGKFSPPDPKKQMPSGPKLTAYASAHFGGDTAKATAYLKQQGYE